jgi:hypothetical protein
MRRSGDGKLSRESNNNSIEGKKPSVDFLRKTHLSEQQKQQQASSSHHSERQREKDLIQPTDQSNTRSSFESSHTVSEPDDQRSQAVLSQNIEKMQEIHKNKENNALKKKLEHSISRLKYDVVRRYEAPFKWKPSGWQYTQWEQQNYHEALNKLDQIKQWLPEIVLKDPSEAKDVSSQKFGAEKIDHPDEPRPEAASLPDNQCSQATLPQNIEKTRKDKIIAGIEMLPRVRFEEYDTSRIYETITIMHDSIQKVIYR